MRGIGLIALLAAMLIMGVLTVTKLKKKSAAALEKAGIETPKSLPELPADVKRKLDAAAESAKQRTKEAMEGVE